MKKKMTYLILSVLMIVLSSAAFVGAVQAAEGHPDQGIVLKPTNIKTEFGTYRVFRINGKPVVLDDMIQGVVVNDPVCCQRTTTGCACAAVDCSKDCPSSVVDDDLTTQDSSN